MARFQELFDRFFASFTGCGSGRLFGNDVLFVINNRPTAVNAVPAIIAAVKGSLNMITPATAAIAVCEAFSALTKTTDAKCNAFVSAQKAATLQMPAPNNRIQSAELVSWSGDNP